MTSPRIGKICYFHNPHASGHFHGYQLSTLDPSPYFLRPIRGGRPWMVRAARRRLAALCTAAGIDSMYRSRDAAYMAFIEDFVDAFANYDVIILATYNPIHPEILHHRLVHPTKILGFIDDPHSTYVRGLPYLWAFDGAFYISPGYSDDYDFQTALASWGCPASHWFPLVPRRLPEFQASDSFFVARDVDVVYIGGSYGDKIDRLAQLKRALGPSFRVHGRWGLKGYIGFARGFLGKPVYPHRVLPLTDAERTSLYCRAKIGVNMHLSSLPAETGNMRMYEVPAHGALLLCDKSALDTHDRIFRANHEAVYYEDLDDAISKIRYFLTHETERVAIARCGYERAQREYTFDAVLLDLLDWAVSLPRQ